MSRFVKCARIGIGVSTFYQLVEDEQFIGTLIDTNERVIAALETYDNVSHFYQYFNLAKIIVDLRCRVGLKRGPRGPLAIFPFTKYR